MRSQHVDEGPEHRITAYLAGRVRAILMTAQVQTLADLQRLDLDVLDTQHKPGWRVLEVIDDILVREDVALLDRLLHGSERLHKARYIAKREGSIAQARRLLRWYGVSNLAALEALDMDRVERERRVGKYTIAMVRQAIETQDKRLLSLILPGAFDVPIVVPTGAGLNRDGKLSVRSLLLPRQRDVLRLRRAGIPLKDIGLRSGVTRERIRQIEKRGWERLARLEDAQRQGVPLPPQALADLEEFRMPVEIVAPPPRPPRPSSAKNLAGYYSVADAVRATGLCQGTIRARISRGLIPVVRIGPRIAITPEEVERLRALGKLKKGPKPGFRRRRETKEQ